jgi:hypothetical protein
LVIYDFILLLPAEVQHFWAGRTSLTSVLFFINRYIWLFLAPFAAWSKFVDLGKEVSCFNMLIVFGVDEKIGHLIDVRILQNTSLPKQITPSVHL